MPTKKEKTSLSLYTKWGKKIFRGKIEKKMMRPRTIDQGQNENKSWWSMSDYSLTFQGQNRKKNIQGQNKKNDYGPNREQQMMGKKISQEQIRKKMVTKNLI